MSGMRAQVEAGAGGICVIWLATALPAQATGAAADFAVCGLIERESRP